MRDRLIEATIRLLADDGPWAIRARAVAAEVGASTTVVYTTFGGMPGLVQAVADEGFNRLGAAFAAVPRSDDAMADAAGLALAYRDFAQAGPHLFDLMFGLSTPGGHGAARRGSASAQDGSAAFVATYSQLLDIAERAVRDGRVETEDAGAVAAQLWSFVHGFTTLELTGHLDAFADPVRDVMLPLATTVTVGLGDAPDRARASCQAAVRRWSAATR